MAEIKEIENPCVWVLYCINENALDITRVFSSAGSGVQWFLTTYNPNHSSSWKMHRRNDREYHFSFNGEIIYALTKWNVYD